MPYSFLILSNCTAICGCEECVEVDRKYFMTEESFLMTTKKYEKFQGKLCTFLDLNVKFDILWNLDVMSLKTVENVQSFEEKLYIAA